MSANNTSPLTFGLDIGIASVGWAVLNETRVVDLGVRAFDKAETAKEGESLNLARRMARLMRRRLHRRAWRLTKLSRFLRRQGLIEDVAFFKAQPSFTDSAWLLRVAGLDRLLSPTEWARVIYHLCKHRGFHWVSKAEEKKADGDAKGEGGKVKQGLAGTAKLMLDKGYRTAAEMVLAEFPDAQRNKAGEYKKALSRVLLAKEVTDLFATQRRFGNPHASLEIEAEVLGSGDRKSGFFWAQKPALSGKDLLKMLGKCTFEKSEYRAPKASFTAERHVWLTRLNNLRIVVDGETRALNSNERQIALPLPYNQVSDFTYKQLRAALVKAGCLPESFRFSSFSYAQSADGKAKDPESERLIKLPAWQELRKAFKDADLESEWLQISIAALEGKPEQLDQIAWVLSVYKDDAEIEAELRQLNLLGGEKLVQALLVVSFDKFHALSLKALRLIVPEMEKGLRYDEAVKAIPEYGHHSQLHVAGAGELKYLPSFYSGRDETGRLIFNEDMDVPRNPVVLRALNQARKVVNALIKEYGSPHSVHIELARDLSKPFDERKQIERDQKEYRDRNESDRTRFAEHFGANPRGAEFEKWRLYREQDGKCAYSLQALDLHRLLELGYAEIDHALPYSRSFDDSKNNKVLVLTKENRDKGNQTPYEYLDGKHDSERWRNFLAWVESNKNYRLAKRSRMLRKNFGQDEAKEFRDRNLNDTRYICKFFKNYVERYLQLAEGNENKRCVVVSGQLTSLLRARWGFNKVRSESDRHHALDAVVVAACSHGMVKRMSDYSRRKELQQVREGFVDMETGEIVNLAMFAQNQLRLQAHFPEPWANFRNEVEARLKVDDPAQLRAHLQVLGTYPPEALERARPLFVSRAPQRRNSGAAHKETVYGKASTKESPNRVTEKASLSSLTLKDVDIANGRLVEPHRNVRLYAAIRERLQNYAVNGGKFGVGGNKAFPLDNPLYKPDKNGEPTGPIVRTVTLEIKNMTGIALRGGVAKNDTMLRVDVFTKADRFHLVPVYVHHRVTGLPNRAVVAFKDESEWTLIDESFEFLFSLHPNDLVKVQQKGKPIIQGYYASCHRGTGNLNIWAHDRNQQVGREGQIEGIGVKTALSIEKFEVDVLGHIYPAKKEKQGGLA